MSSLGKITNSISSFTNENTVALVNVNLDLSLFRCEPIAEFLPVGSALTKRRKDEAESGKTHKTACILGFLFNDIIPDTPELRKAYGKRVSEILSRPDVNPHGTENDGPFQPFIGTDCTSIWAAATSGDAAISVLLLACMLANLFDAKTSVSIWSELIEERKQRVMLLLDQNKMINPNTIVAARQDIGRSELRTWDTSVRSWLRQADLSMKTQKTQFTLIAENITIPYPGGGSLFERVITTWTRAMEVLEHLLNNHPQQACDRAIISGISSWHLYPDLLVFQEEVTKVTFNDSLVPKSAVLSLNLEYKGSPSDNFIRWSLALSHLKYYGDPVVVRSNERLQRVSMPQIWLVALGSVLQCWQLPYTLISKGMEWFEELGKKLHSSAGAHRSELSWLLKLCASVTSLDNDKHEIALKLVKYGYRKGHSLLGSSENIRNQTPFFGLCNPAITDALDQETEVETGIEFLRLVANRMNLQVHEAIISYEVEINGHYYLEIATVGPIKTHLAGDASDEDLEVNNELKYARWILYVSGDEEGPSIPMLQDRFNLIQRRGEICSLRTCHSKFQLDRTGKLHTPRQRAYHLFWDNSPRFLSGQQPTDFGNSSNLVMGSSYNLWVKSSVPKMMFSEETIRKVITEDAVSIDVGLMRLRGMVGPEKISNHLLACITVNFNEIRSATYTIPSKKRKRSIDSIYRDASHCYRIITYYATQPITEFLVSLRALEIANEVYKGLSDATVSLRIVEQDILKAAWLPSFLKEMLRSADGRYNKEASRCAVMEPVESLMGKMTRAEYLSCVAMFESGYFNIDPAQLGDVIALTYENSIFVSEILISDPTADASGLGLRYMVGNVGHAGMVFMVSPAEPRIRPVQHDAGTVEHRPYDYKVIDSLRGTSLHLSFTTWKMPLDWESTGEIDQEVFLLESVVSVQDSGKWVADIDVLNREEVYPEIISFPCQCEVEKQQPWMDAVSLDTWEELLDLPPCLGVLRASGNWVARLAAASILVQQGHAHSVAIIQGDRVCWNCLRELYSEPEPHLPQVLIY
ncbi:hypothetical protein PT974_03657 [Cladobotryum mycophilum]|uniref:Uncharacterized protein n=1 Tax=Cladobotryum mycophilum TaxID=491253 RepID=A0ABR0SSX8_9HYPO